MVNIGHTDQIFLKLWSCVLVGVGLEALEEAVATVFMIEPVSETLKVVLGRST